MGRDKKRIAVLVRDRQREAVRMAVGLTLADDEVSVFIIDAALDLDEQMAESIEALVEMNASIFSNESGSSFEYMSTGEIALAILENDVIIPY